VRDGLLKKLTLTLVTRKRSEVRAIREAVRRLKGGKRGTRKAKQESKDSVLSRKGEEGRGLRPEEKKKRGTYAPGGTEAGHGELRRSLAKFLNRSGPSPR